jgi:hypothetical protein
MVVEKKNGCFEVAPAYKKEKNRLARVRRKNERQPFPTRIEIEKNN